MEEKENNTKEMTEEELQQKIKKELIKLSKEFNLLAEYLEDFKKFFKYHSPLFHKKKLKKIKKQKIKHINSDSNKNLLNKKRLITKKYLKDKSKNLEEAIQAKEKEKIQNKKDNDNFSEIEEINLDSSIKSDIEKDKENNSSDNENDSDNDNKSLINDNINSKDKKNKRKNEISSKLYTVKALQNGEVIKGYRIFCKCQGISMCFGPYDDYNFAFEFRKLIHLQLKSFNINVPNVPNVLDKIKEFLLRIKETVDKKQIPIEMIRRNKNK